MAHIIMAYVVMAHIVMAHIIMAYIVMACIVMAYIVMAYIVMGYIVMTYVVMEVRIDQRLLRPGHPEFGMARRHGSQVGMAVRRRGVRYVGVRGRDLTRLKSPGQLDPPVRSV